MVNVNVIGRLGNDSEVINGKNGQFLSFRLATDDFKNGEKTTSWMRVTFNGEKGVKMAEWLKKGRMVNVMGTEFVSIYTDKSGQPQISRDISANNVEFVNIGSGQTQSDTSSEVTPTTGKLEKPVEQAKTKKVEAVAAAATSEPEDDLPF